MAYLNIDPDFPEHPKTRRLIGLTTGNAEGLLIRLWCFIAKYHGGSGRLPGYTSEEIEAVVRWDGPKGQLVGALCTVGFLHKEKEGYRIHDWLEHQGHLGVLHERAKKGAKARWDKLKGRSSPDVESNASSIAQASVKQCPSLEERFGEVWKQYPDRVGRKAAFRSFEASVKTEADFADIKRALANYLGSERVKNGYVQNGSTWFNNWRDWVDFVERRTAERRFDGQPNTHAGSGSPNGAAAPSKFAGLTETVEV